MKASIESTTAIVEMKDCVGRKFTARVWEGVTAAGVAFTAYIAIAQVKREDDNSEFVRELVESPDPNADTQRAIDMRFII
jgi:hypothetical protein